MDSLTSRAEEFVSAWKRRQSHESAQGQPNRHTSDMISLGELILAMAEKLDEFAHADEAEGLHKVN